MLSFNSIWYGVVRWTAPGFQCINVSSRKMITQYCADSIIVKVLIDWFTSPRWGTSTIKLRRGDHWTSKHHRDIQQVSSLYLLLYLTRFFELIGIVHARAAALHLRPSLLFNALLTWPYRLHASEFILITPYANLSHTINC